MDGTWRAALAIGSLVLGLATPGIDVRAGQSAPTVYAGRLDGPIDLAVGSRPHTIASMTLPPGRFIVWAKLQLDGTAPGDLIPQVRCSLRGTDPDDIQSGWAWLGPEANHHASSAMALQIATRVTGAHGHASLACATSSPGIARDVVLAAMSAGRLTTIRLSDGSSVTTGSHAPVAIHAARRGAVAIPSGTTTHVADVPLAAGSWWVTTSFVIDDTDTDFEDPHGSDLWCQLLLGNEVDRAAGWIPAKAFEGDRRVITLDAAAPLTSDSQVRVNCHAVDGNLEVRSLHLTAVRLNTLRRAVAPGPVHMTGSGAPRVDHITAYGDQEMSLTATTVASLAVGAQPRLVVGKVSILEESGPRLACGLAGGGSDRSFRDEGTGYTLPLMMAIDPSAPTAVRLRCADLRDPHHPTVVRDVKLTTLVLGALIVRTIGHAP